MTDKEIRTQAELYCLFKKIIADRVQLEDIEFSGIELEYRVRPTRKRADLILFAKEKTEERPFLVIETKRSREHEPQETDYNQLIYVTGFGMISINEAMAKGLLDKFNYKYHSGAIQQAKEYAESLQAPFYSVCYADSLYVRSFVELHGLFYPSVDYSNSFGLRVLNELVSMYRTIGHVEGGGSR